MKLNLGCGNDVRPGYVNIDRMPQGQAPPDIYRQGDISSLDWLTEDGTVDEMVALDCLEYLPTKVLKQTLINWAKKNNATFTGMIIPNVFGPFGIPFFTDGDKEDNPESTTSSGGKREKSAEANSESICSNSEF